ncbi:MAG TPA: nucleotidyltransferase domain-containing protein [Methylomirabilota bacterium]|jgi:predicted nucleotidyltransferase|nr:nucleotidyltransferase domain-containing protein [Methylomirabilota bacterium]
MAKKGSPRKARKAENGKSPRGYEQPGEESLLPPPLGWRVTLGRFVDEIKRVYGRRLQSVVLYGSRARGDAGSGSDVDTLVVLDPLGDFWTEFDRICEVANRVSRDASVVLSARPVDAHELANGGSPLMMNVRREGKPVS